VAGLDQVENQFVANRSEVMHRWLLSVGEKRKTIVISKISTFGTLECCHLPKTSRNSTTSAQYCQTT
jgi:hypothetical protein